MSNFIGALFRLFGNDERQTVEPKTRHSWVASHTRRETHDARTNFVLGLLTTLSLLLLPTFAAAQELEGGRLQVRAPNGSSAQLPLIDEKLAVDIDQGHASTEFQHTFQNESSANLEGRYVINLGAVATATGFSYWNGEKRIVGEIFEKEAARRVYETISGTGRDPGLLERTGEGQFSFQVSPIAAGEKKRIQVTTAQWLRQTEDTIEYIAPLGRDGKGSYIHLKDSRPIEKIWSPTHRLTVEGSDNTRRIRVGTRTGKSKRLVLRYRIQEAPFELSTAIHRTKGQDAYAVVSLSTPKGLRGAPKPRDVTLVVDRSGSMTGEPLAAARRATEGVLKRLSPGDSVNVVSFDYGTDSLYAHPRPVKEVRQEAIQFTRRMNAGGGTDLALALSEALARQKKSNRSQLILFLTDGQSNPQQALEAAAKAPSSVRLYTVGIGTGVDRALLSRLARDNRGRFTFVADEKNLERDVDHLFSRIESPTLADLKLKLDGAEMRRVYPRKAPDLFRRDQLTFAMRMRPRGAKKAMLRISATHEGKRRVFTKSVDLSSQHRPWVGRLWGQNRVDDLLEQMSLEGETEELKTETIELALAYNIVTRYTSFLAIPESEITDAVRGTLKEERARRASLLKKHQDAAALSRSVMPPGDPIITVRAPRSAQGVSAVFPFGLTLDLSYNEKSEVWEGRFLVPNHVSDGPYQVEIFVVDREGTVTATTTNYEIDSQAPGFEVATTEEIGGVRLAVNSDEALREVRVFHLGEKSKIRIQGVPCGTGGCQLDESSQTNFVGMLELPPGTHRLRIVVTDKARNESSRVLTVSIPTHEEGC